MRWFFPSWNGDFRLERITDSTTMLSIVQPTAAELQVITHIEALAKKKGWCDEKVQFWKKPYRKKATRHTKLDVSINEIGPMLVKKLKPGEQTLTAVRFSNDRIEIIEGADVDLSAIEKTVEAEEKAAKPPKPKAAASVKRPTPSCPDCYVDAVGPATDTLLAFLSDEQHEQWREHRAIIVYGNLSGHRYILAHRHTELAAQFGKICWDADDNAQMKFHDNSVPPEEEVLAAKLILEHRESWLRNEATTFGVALGVGSLERREKFKNPFGDFSDGIPDTLFTSEVGRFFSGMAKGYQHAKGN